MEGNTMEKELFNGTQDNIRGFLVGGGQDQMAQNILCGLDLHRPVLCEIYRARTAFMVCTCQR